MPDYLIPIRLVLTYSCYLPVPTLACIWTMPVCYFCFWPVHPVLILTWTLTFLLLILLYLICSTVADLVHLTLHQSWVPMSWITTSLQSFSLLHNLFTPSYATPWAPQQMHQSTTCQLILWLSLPSAVFLLAIPVCSLLSVIPSGKAILSSRLESQFVGNPL